MPSLALYAKCAMASGDSSDCISTASPNLQVVTAMIELHSNSLQFRFPDLEASLRERVRRWIDSRLTTTTAVERSRLPSLRAELDRHFDRILPDVRAKITFQRTLRIPDDGKDYSLPPGLGEFPVRHVDDYDGVPGVWKKRGGVMLPMHRTEAMWLHCSADYPMAVKVGAGGICAISGERWSTGLRQPLQNYLVLPDQPWLDGFRVSEGVIRQFVAVPLGKGLTVEQQLTGEESWGGLQLQAFPLRPERYSNEVLIPEMEEAWNLLIRPRAGVDYICSPESRIPCPASPAPIGCYSAAGLGAGGRMKQQIVADTHGVGAWDLQQTSRCFVHLCLAEDWRRLTGAPPPHQPPTAQDYTDAGMPWFDYDSGQAAVTGATMLSGVKSVNTLVEEKTGLCLADNNSVAPTKVVKLAPRNSTIVREW
jgi:hypothetical protein